MRIQDMFEKDINRSINGVVKVAQDDDASIRDVVRLYLEDAGYEVREAADGRQAVGRVADGGVDLVLLDIMMPVLDGYGALREIRRTSNVPVILLSAKGQDPEKILGLNLGADDYIAKPFSLREVAARVKAVLRRSRPNELAQAPTRITYQTLVLDATKKKVCIDEEEVPLTKKEFEILQLLLQNQGRVFSREDILSRVWSDEVYVLDRTIDVNITRLRKKIGKYGKCIVTRLGYGYCFENE